LSAGDQGNPGSWTWIGVGKCIKARGPISRELVEHLPSNRRSVAKVSGHRVMALPLALIAR
jgi:hypothetical protein